MTHSRDPLYKAAADAIAEEAKGALRHDMRNKFATIQNATFYLRKKMSGSEVWQQDPRIEKFLDMINSELAICVDMLDARTKESSLPLTEVAACATAVFGSLQIPESVTLHVEGHATLPIVEEELALALRCLLENSVEAVGERGEITVTLQEQGDHCLITLQDSGPGIDESAQTQKPFRSSRPGHANLGLAIARRTAMRYGGSLTIAPALPCRVVLALPISQGSDES